MAADQFTAELESLCRIRRERNAIIRTIRDVRRVLVDKLSRQEEGQIRQWVSDDIALAYDNLERVSNVLDGSLGRYLEGPVIQRHEDRPKLPAANTVEIKDGKVVDPNDKRPIKGPGRRHHHHHYA
jgi:hypothetical protein